MRGGEGRDEKKERREEINKGVKEEKGKERMKEEKKEANFLLYRETKYTRLSL